MPAKSISNIANFEPFEIHSVQWILQNKIRQTKHVKRFSNYHLLWIRKGTGVHYIDTARYDIKNNTLFCIFPGQIHVLNLFKDTEGYLISFDTDFLEMAHNEFFPIFHHNQFVAQQPFSKISICHTKEEEIAQILDSMSLEFQNFYLLRKEVLRNYLKIFLIKIARHIDRPANDSGIIKTNRYLKKFFDLLHQNFKKVKSVSEYAGMMAVSATYLNEVIKSATGFPVSYHIQQHVIIEAKRQALFTDLSMKEIAYGLGFDDITHFSKYFKGFAGQNFTEYRKKATEEFHAS